MDRHYNQQQAIENLCFYIRDEERKGGTDFFVLPSLSFTQALRKRTALNYCVSFNIYIENESILSGVLFGKDILNYSRKKSFI